MTLVRRWRWLVLGGVVLASGCNNPNNGQTAAANAPVPDGRVVLVRRSNEFGAFILHNQTGKPETTDYTWFYRADGQGTLAPSDPAVLSGHETNATQVAFQTFSIGWSINENGKGWIYFSKLPTELKKDADYEMCVTTATNLAGIDARSSKWQYQGSGRVNLKALIKSQFKEGP